MLLYNYDRFDQMIHLYTVYKSLPSPNVGAFLRLYSSLKMIHQESFVFLSSRSNYEGYESKP